MNDPRLPFLKCPCGNEISFMPDERENATDYVVIIQNRYKEAVRADFGMAAYERKYVWPIADGKPVPKDNRIARRRFMQNQKVMQECISHMHQCDQCGRIFWKRDLEGPWLVFEQIGETTHCSGERET